MAYELVAERGLAGLSMRAVARRVGATTGLVSHHFLDRAELVSAALDHAAWVMQHRSIEAGGADAHPVELLVSVLPTDPATVENWRFALSVRAAALSDDDYRRFDDAIAQHWAGFLPQRLGRFVTGDASAAADHLVAVADGVALRAAVNPRAWPAERQRAHVQLAFDALTTQGAFP
ncbi:MAG: TetR/AcrR family transcriptional regulator [Microthrixaceae bacterium]